MRRLEAYLRSEAPPNRGYLVLRGSPNTVAKLMESARRLASQYTFRGRPAYGVSVSVVTTAEDLDHLLQTTAYQTRHHYRHGTVGEVEDAGFTLLPSFRSPTHHTVLLEPYTVERAAELIAALPHEQQNPYYVGRSR